jgi:hypothetical protein
MRILGSLFYRTTVEGHFLAARLSFQRNPFTGSPERVAGNGKQYLSDKRITRLFQVPSPGVSESSIGNYRRRAPLDTPHCTFFLCNKYLRKNARRL